MEPDDEIFYINMSEDQKGLRPIRVKEHADGSKSIEEGSLSTSSDEDDNEEYKDKEKR